MKVERFQQGSACWTDLSTTDEAGALAFYSAMFGWTDDPNETGTPGIHYHMQRLGGDYVCAIARQRSDEAERGVPPHWATYLSVDDVDAAAARVPGAGGAVVAPPFDVLEAGRMSVIADPTGGIVSLWQAKNHPGAGVVREANAMGWNELMTPDPARAAAFFSKLLGVESSQAPAGDGAPYTMLQVGGEAVAGILQMTPEMGQMPPNWLTYFQVADLATALAKLQGLGGQLVAPPMDAPGVRFAVVQDPQGAVFGLIQPLE